MSLTPSASNVEHFCVLYILAAITSPPIITDFFAFMHNRAIVEVVSCDAGQQAHSLTPLLEYLAILSIALILIY